MVEKHLRFIIAIPLVMMQNIYNKITAKYVYIWVTIPQLWCMVYLDMNRIAAVDRIEKFKSDLMDYINSLFKY